MEHKRLSLQDFKNWMSEQKDLSCFFNIESSENPYEKHIGKPVRSKVSKKKLLEKTDTDSETLIDEFLEEGGTILSVEDKRVQIEVESGEFFLPRFCVKIIKEA